MSRASARFGAVVVLAVALAAALPPARGQTVTGRITSRADGTPVSGAIVVLVDSAGRAVATRLAEDAGTFQLSAPAGGSYMVRVERVGFRSATSAPFIVRQGETRDVPMTVVSEGVSLKALRVSADRRCVVRPQEGLAAAQLWEEARKALSATRLTQMAQAAAKVRHDPHRFSVRIRKYSRELDPHSLVALHDEGYEVEGEVITPFVTADPDSLAREGYVIGSLDTGRTYYAPDAAILLSDGFLDSHCFRVQEPGRGKNDALIGLAFEPVRLTKHEDRTPIEVQGVLWLDRASAELRYMEFGYANLPPEERNDRIGGQVEFRPLPDGRWVVWRWTIRVPRYERRVKLGDGIRPSESRLELVRVHEEGSEILTVRPPAGRAQGLATLRGSVVDSLRGVAMAGVRVFLSGTAFAAVTDGAGSYVIDSIPAGRYVASVITPRLDSLLLDPPSHDVALSASEDRRLDFALPSFATLTARLCSDVAPDSLSLIVGVIRDTASTVASGARVSAEWMEVRPSGTRALSVRPIQNATFTTARGRYALCGLPTATSLTLRARHGEQAIMSKQPPAARGEVRRVDLTLRKP
jgi:hypothetical protein